MNDPEKYVKEIILPRLKKDAQGKYVMPDSFSDFERFTGLHSWYKHFRGRLVKIYPILMVGEEPRNDIGPCFSDDNQDNLHWWFINRENLDRIDDSELEYGIPINLPSSKYFPTKIMREHYVHLDNTFGNCFGDHSAEKLRIFHVTCMKQECTEVWKEILRIINKIEKSKLTEEKSKLTEEKSKLTEEKSELTEEKSELTEEK